MKTFPMFLRMNGRRVVICGGGEDAARKARLMLKTEAEIVVLAQDLDPELSALVAVGRAVHHAALQSDTFDRAVLVFIASGDEERDRELAAVARAAGAVVNVIDRPEMCDAYTPSIVDRDPVVVAIGTEGTAPVLGRAIKTEIETMLAPRLGAFAALAGRLRQAVADNFAPRDRRGFWEWAFTAEPFRTHLAGRERAAAQMLKTAIKEGGAGKALGHIALVGAGPGARDLLTMRAVRRLQEADTIFYDRTIDPEVLELARRDAERRFIGLEQGKIAGSQDRIDRLILAEAKRGRRVVRLLSGDPAGAGSLPQGRPTGSTDGIEAEVVPGISAAPVTAIAAPCRTEARRAGQGRDGTKHTDTVAMAQIAKTR